MILSTIRMAISSKKRNEALKILKMTMDHSKLQPGFIASDIYEDLQDDHILMFREIWQNQELLDRHLRSDEYRNVLLVMEMAEKTPEIRFDTISDSTGIETVEKARKYKG